MKLTLLGSGGSYGVPMIGCDCAVCLSDNPKNKRSRVSLLVETEGRKILIDTSPDLRTQCLRAGLETVDAILYTHAHADHIHGIDDLRSLNFHRGGSIPCFTNAATLAEIRERFGYVFREVVPEYGWFRPSLIPNEITPGEAFEAEGVRVMPFVQVHGKIDSIGYRIGDVAYSTDLKAIPSASAPHLEGLKLWIVDCLKYEPAPTHAHLALTLEWIARFKPERAILTHLAHEMDYDMLQAQLPAGVEVGYDGMVVEV